MDCVLVCMLDAVEGGLCLLEALEVPEVMRCVLLCVLEVPEAMRCVLLCMLEAGLSLLEVFDVLKVLEVMRSVLLCMLKAVGRGICFGASKFPLWQFSRYSS